MVKAIIKLKLNKNKTTFGANEIHAPVRRKFTKRKIIILEIDDF